MNHGWYTDDILVGGLEHEWIIFPYIGHVRKSQLTNSIIFQRGRWLNHQPVMSFYPVRLD